MLGLLMLLLTTNNYTLSGASLSDQRSFITKQENLIQISIKWMAFND